MPIYKMSVYDNGMIHSVHDLSYLSDWDAAGHEGYIIDDHAEAEAMLADLADYSARRWYDIDNDVLLDRPVLEIEPVKLLLNMDSGDTLVIHNLPIPCTVKIDGQEYHMDDPEDTTFECVIDHPGTYEVRVEAWPYQDKTWEVEVI